MVVKNGKVGCLSYFPWSEYIDNSVISLLFFHDSIFDKCYDNYVSLYPIKVQIDMLKIFY